LKDPQSKNEAIIAKVKSALKDHELDAFFVFGADNITYLTQVVIPFANNYPNLVFASILPRQGEGYIFCPPSCEEAVTDQGWQGQVLTYSAGFPFSKFVNSAKYAFESLKLQKCRIGLDYARIPKTLFDLLKTMLPDVEWIKADEIFRQLRILKTPEELEYLEIASRVSDRAIVSALNHLEGTVDPVGYTLVETAERMRVHVGEFGGAVTGHVSAVQSASGQLFFSPVRGKVTDGQFLRYDLTCQYGGGWSRGGRTVFIGNPTEDHFLAYQQNLILKNTAINSLRAGLECKDVYNAVGVMAENEGINFFKEAGVGHGIGFSEREAPFLNASNNERLQTGMVIVLDIITYGPMMELVHSLDTYVIRESNCELLNWYRNWDRLYLVTGTTARHG